jgi:hypothetical protein
VYAGLVELDDGGPAPPAEKTGVRVAGEDALAAIGDDEEVAAPAAREQKKSGRATK